MIRVAGLRKTFGDAESAVTAVDDVAFEVPRGTVVGLLGPNGAGKTTTIKCLLGLVRPDAGTVEVAEQDVTERPRHAYERIGAMLEGARNVYWRLTVRENLAFFAGLGGDDPADLRDRHTELIETFDLEEFADATVNELSRGMKQKVSLATTLARDVDVVFMDEPTLGLDVETSLELRSTLSELATDEDVTILLSSHDMDVIEAVCDSVMVLNDGSVVAHDDVDSLLDVFRTQQYEVTLEPPVDADVRRRLERTVGADCTAGDERVTVTFTATRGDEMYDVMAVLAETGQDLRDVESVEPDLEEVFLQLTDTGAGDGDDAPTDEAPDRPVADDEETGSTSRQRPGGTEDD